MSTAILILTIVQVLLCLFLIVTILLQPSKHAGINGSISGAADSFLSKNQAKTWEARLSKLTTAASIIFVICTLAIYIL